MSGDDRSSLSEARMPLMTNTPFAISSTGLWGMTWAHKAAVTPLGRRSMSQSWRLRTGRCKQHGNLVPMDLAPAGILGGAVDERGLGRQEDRIGSV